MATLKEIQLAVAIFEGRSISLEEAKKIRGETNQRMQVLKATFGLTDEEIHILCLNKDEVKGLALGLKENLKEKGRESLLRVEGRVLHKMRDPNGGRHLRAIFDR